MNYEIFAYGNVDALMGLFNALAALMNSNIFLTAIALVFVVGFFAAFLAMALAPDRLAGPKWLASAVLVFVVLFLPKATVQIVDKTGATAPAVIDNVPLGLAFQAGMVSSVGNTLTDLFETALQVLPGPVALPASLNFSDHGLMFGAHLVERSRTVGFTDQYFRADMLNFLQNCSFYDVSQGFISADAFANSTDLWPLLATTNPARFSQITNAAGVASAVTCPVAYASLNARMPATLARLLAKMGLETNPALQLVPGPMPVAAATTAINAQLPAAYIRARLATAATNAAQILQQNAMINAVQEANLMMSQRTDDPSATLLGVSRAQATAQLNAQQITAGRIASEALPLVRNGLEAVLYGIFPFILLLALLYGSMPALKLLKGYGLGLVWLALWPPIYAIMNYLGTLAWAKSAASAGYLASTGATGMALLSASPVYGNTVSTLGTVGNLVIAVPVIAAAVVFGLNKLAGVAAGFTAAGASASGPIANESVKGNIAQGNVRFEQQQLHPNRTDAHMSAFEDVRGKSTIDERTGEARYQQNIGSNVVGMRSSSEIATRFSEASAQSQAHATALSKQADQSLATAFDRVLANASATSNGSAGSAGYAERHGAGQDSSWNKAAQIRDQLAHDLGITDTSKATSALALALGVGNSKSVGASASGTDDKGFRIDQAVKSLADLGIQSRGQQLTDNTIQSAVQRAQQAAEAAGITDAGRLVDEYSRSEDFRRLQSTNREEADRISAARSDALRYSEGASSAFRQADEYRESAEALRAAALRGEIDWTTEFNTYLHRNGALGVTGDEALVWANRFFREAGVGIGADGQPKAVLFDGAGPTNVTVTPGSYRDTGRLRHEHESTPLVIGGEAVTPQSVATGNLADRAVVRAQGTGAQAGVPTSEDDLRFNYDKERFVQSVNRDNAGVDVESERRGEQARFDEAAEHTSIFHHLGDQPDGRSARQQLRDERAKGQD